MVESNWKTLPDWGRVIASCNNENLKKCFLAFSMYIIYEVMTSITPSSRKKDTTRNECQTNYCQKIYSSRESHTTFKAKDALRKKLSRANAVPLTQSELEEKRRKDREW